MKELIFVRHAKSDWGHEGLKDIDRCLSERGYKDAYLMSKWYHQNKKTPQLLLSSPAVRALSTALIFMRELELGTNNLHLDRSIYESSKDNLITLIKKQKDSFKSIMLFGHNPGFTEICNAISDKYYFDNVPTSGIVSFTLDVSSWKNLKLKSAVLNYQQFPKEYRTKA